METFEARSNQFVMAMVLACRGEVKARQDVSSIIGRMMQDAEAAPLCDSLMQIIVGERDRQRLTRSLEGEPAMLVNRILDELNT